MFSSDEIEPNNFIHWITFFCHRFFSHSLAVLFELKLYTNINSKSIHAIYVKHIFFVRVFISHRASLICSHLNIVNKFVNKETNHLVHIRIQNSLETCLVIWLSQRYLNAEFVSVFLFYTQFHSIHASLLLCVLNAGMKWHWIVTIPINF